MKWGILQCTRTFLRENWLCSKAWITFTSNNSSIYLHLKLYLNQYLVVQWCSVPHRQLRCFTILPFIRSPLLNLLKCNSIISRLCREDIRNKEDLKVTINSLCNLINNLLSSSTLKFQWYLRCPFLCLLEDNRLKFLTLSRKQIKFNNRIVCSQLAKKMFKRSIQALKIVRGDVKLQVVGSLEATLVSKGSMQTEDFGISSRHFPATATLEIRTLLR